MILGGGLDQKRVGEFQAQIKAGGRPTALALSMLYKKQPAHWEGEPRVTVHHCLAHYLIDGHHKVFAASQLGRPIGVMSALFLGFPQGPTMFEHMQLLRRLPGLVSGNEAEGRWPAGFAPKSSRKSWKFW
jgi:hypothetical protein